MKIYSLTCTRSENNSSTTTNLLEYFKKCDIQSKLLVDEKSIFEAYENGLDSLDASFDDIVILCHDDIEILTDPKVFTSLLKEKLSQSDTGFVGVAGTTNFTQSAVWWDQANWQAGKHSGYVFHGDNIHSMSPTHFGPLAQTVVMDGVFLAATKRTLRSIQLAKPKVFPGNWDFYDIFYTYQAHLKGKKNYTVAIQIRHESIGELAGRDSWHKNREAFIGIFSRYLPTSI
mgnify:CR=1 FL=1